MSYTLHRLAPGSYDLILSGEIVGSVVRELGNGNDAPIWHAELLGDPPSERRPPPFSRIDHVFGTLDAVVLWLDGASVLDTVEQR
ncbi:hypothetical protein ASF41_10450 [Methylobacterium sp. Leaf111]|uniref:hypothetical protein n=1 Tax=Methylobacterium sp. Leaf111 TaxID=1736257 RepID=UPI0006FC65C2|nr:hypothetical protein [Methylobacterium sp. Leaf111]KQP60089.1 hypothetical protein ASF41_10450 [Methylobacterium sp. Leaf111]